MKPRYIVYLLASYALVFWCSADAIGPLAMFLPYIAIGGLMADELFTLVMLACYLGIAGAILACVASSPKVRLVSAALLILSATFFVATSSPWMFSAMTAIPFAAISALCIYRSVYPNEKRANSESSVSQQPTQDSG